MKKCFYLILSAIWFLLVAVHSALVAISVEFPHLTNKFILYASLFLLPSLLFISLYLVSGMGKSNKRFVLKIGIKLMLIVLIPFCFIYAGWTTNGWTNISSAYYPVYSFSDESSDYLVIDKQILNESEKKYFEVFPKKLPINFTGIKYRYYCADSPFGSYWYVYTFFKLPKIEFDEEVYRIALIYHIYGLILDQTDKTLVYMSNENVESDTFFTVTIDKENRSIEYINSYCIKKDDVLKGEKDFPRYNLK